MSDNLRALPNGDLQFNRGAYCPLTLYNADITLAKEIQGYFELSDPVKAIESLRRLFHSGKLKAREIEEAVLDPLWLDLSHLKYKDEAELFFYLYAAYYYRRKTIERAEEAEKHGAIEGLEYVFKNCPWPECLKNKGRIYSIKEAKEIKFKPGCRCDLSPYNSKWK